LEEIIHQNPNYKVMASIIDLALAKSLIKEFQNQNASENGPGLLTPNQQNLNGFFIDRQSLDAILGNPQFVGVSIYLAKHPDFVGAADNIFTLVFAGAEPNTAPGATTPYISTGDIYEMVSPCPPYCSDL
jgi:hypothetical protein